MVDRSAAEMIVGYIVMFAGATLMLSHLKFNESPFQFSWEIGVAMTIAGVWLFHLGTKPEAR